jgi:hypothetical protein
MLSVSSRTRSSMSYPRAGRATTHSYLALETLSHTLDDVRRTVYCGLYIARDDRVGDDQPKPRGGDPVRERIGLRGRVSS